MWGLGLEDRGLERSRGECSHSVAFVVQEFFHHQYGEYEGMTCPFQRSHQVVAVSGLVNIQAWLGLTCSVYGWRTCKEWTGGVQELCAPFRDVSRLQSLGPLQNNERR